ncbi:MAG TPA: ThiF family adenylyltransferase, partial [Vicingaceae bacterium]|nr:ThiF family adenylyltransferase [Vicingaceae bacterium]
MDKLLKERYAEYVCTEKNQMEFEPKFYRISDKNEEQQLTQLIESNPQLVIIDEIESQLKELLKLKHPDKQLTSAELHSLVNKHVGNITYDQYGVWVYYPWRNTLVHLLDEKEFVEVRTNRNQYKITPEEEEILATKKIGIIGLSVGKAIALTMAMERICGEIVLADFDVIELSNLNRIQTGVHHFNTKKTVVAAREIAEIDPYLKVTCYHEGLKESNLNDFFTKDKKLDACIEVCDGLEVKILARQKAKLLGIP